MLVQGLRGPQRLHSLTSSLPKTTTLITIDTIIYGSRSPFSSAVWHYVGTHVLQGGHFSCAACAKLVLCASVHHGGVRINVHVARYVGMCFHKSSCAIRVPVTISV